MLEPSSPAGEPFETQGQEENRATLDFEQVCVSLVERGWKILPKKGSYPINKQGPRYVNLVDPRGNRKSIRVVDPSLWEKLRLVENTRSKKKNNSKSKNKEEEEVSNQDRENNAVVFSETFSDAHSKTSLNSISEQSAIEEISLPTIEAIPQLSITSDVIPAEPALENLARQTSEPSPQESIAQEERPKEIEKNLAPAEILPQAQPSFQNSILQLGLDSLMKSLQSETLSPSDVLRKIQDWMLTSKNLTEYVEKLNERQKIEVPQHTSEKDQLIMELQTMLKETEDRLAALIHTAREI
jgi:hypothetical protein